MADMLPFQIPTNMPMGEGVVELEDGTIDFSGEDIIEGDEGGEGNVSAMSDHYANLADDDNLTDNDLIQIGQDVLDGFTADKESRSEWEAQYERGLKTLDPDDNDTNSGRETRGLSEVQHPLINEAATQFQARAMSELYPSEGCATIRVLGDSTEEMEDQAERVRTYLNYQTLELMPEYIPDSDQMLYHLPYVGQIFTKCWFDTVLNRVTRRFVTVEDLVVHEYDTKDLATCLRATHILRISPNDYKKYVAAGFYLPVETADGVDLAEQSTDADDEKLSAIEQVQGITKSANPKDQRMVFLEQHVDYDVPGYEDKDKIARPYIITVHVGTGKVVAIRRNWAEEDEQMEKEVWFVSWKMLPGLGFHGLGFYHTIGDLGRAATGALRALLDAAEYANLQGGLKLKGRVSGGEIVIGPGEFADIDSPVDDIKKAVMPLPFKEPSQTLFQLLGFIVETGQRFANTIEMSVSDANQNTPVGTTMALLEEGSRVFSAVHKRLHRSQAQELKLIAKLNGRHLEDEYPYNVEGKSKVIARKDFDDRVDVVPVSDPNVFSSTQRVAQAQAILELSRSAPEMHDKYEAYKRMYRALRVPNFESILLDPIEPVRLDPIAENIAVMSGKPIGAYIDQDHMSHMTVLDSWFNGLPPQAQQMYMQQYISHRSEHMALFYRVQLQQRLGADLPDLPDLRDQHAQFEAMDPQTDAQISEAAAMAIQQGPVNMGPPLPGMDQQGGAGGEMEAIAQAEIAKAQAQVQATQIKAQADIQTKQQKAQIDAQLTAQKGQQTLQLKEAEGRQTIQIKQAEAAVDAQLAVQKMMADLEEMKIKAMADIQVAQQKSDAAVEAKMMELMAKAQLEQTKADATAAKEVAEAQNTVTIKTEGE
jgi:hypothetical protein